MVLQVQAQFKGVVMGLIEDMICGVELPVISGEKVRTSHPAHRRWWFIVAKGTLERFSSWMVRLCLEACAQPL